jgi:hypothetical protein
MPYVSVASHNKPYIVPVNFDTQFSDIKKVFSEILKLDIGLPLKRRMLVHTIWEITKLEGSFKGRYRSKGVLVPGLAIQRDHVFQKERIVRCLLEHPDQMETTLNTVMHCVVTKAEHTQLTAHSKANKDIDGWKRYKISGIEVMDMLTGKQLI